MLLVVSVCQEVRMEYEAHRIKNTGNRGEDFASCVNILERVDGVEKVVVVDVPVYSK